MSSKTVAHETYVADILEGIDRRARYLARMMKELDKRGLETDRLMSKIAYEDGLFRAAKAPKVSGADDFVNSHLNTYYHRHIYKSELGQLTPERAEFSIHLHREAEEWKQRLSNEEMARLYGLIINHWKGLANGLGLNMEMTQCIFRGDPVTTFVFTKQ